MLSIQVAQNDGRLAAVKEIVEEGGVEVVAVRGGVMSMNGESRVIW